MISLGDPTVGRLQIEGTEMYYFIFPFLAPLLFCWYGNVLAIDIIMGASLHFEAPSSRTFALATVPAGFTLLACLYVSSEMIPVAWKKADSNLREIIIRRFFIEETANKRFLRIYVWSSLILCLVSQIILSLLGFILYIIFHFGATILLFFILHLILCFHKQKELKGKGLLK